MNVPDGKGNLPPQLFLVKFHPNNLVGESLVEEPVDLGSARQLQRVDGRRTRTLDGSLKVLLKLLDTPANKSLCRNRCGPSNYFKFSSLTAAWPLS